MRLNGFQIHVDRSLRPLAAFLETGLLIITVIITLISESFIIDGLPGFRKCGRREVEPRNENHCRASGGGEELYKEPQSLQQPGDTDSHACLSTDKRFRS